MVYRRHLSHRATARSRPQFTLVTGLEHPRRLQRLGNRGVHDHHDLQEGRSLPQGSGAPQDEVSRLRTEAAHGRLRGLSQKGHQRRLPKNPSVWLPVIALNHFQTLKNNHCVEFKYFFKFLLFRCIIATSFAIYLRSF